MDGVDCNGFTGNIDAIAPRRCEVVCLHDRFWRKACDRQSNDPPYDCSGTVFRLDDGYKLTDYVTLNDFLEEPNSNTRPSFMSGCGLFHDTRGCELREFVDFSQGMPFKKV